MIKKNYISRKYVSILIIICLLINMSFLGVISSRAEASVAPTNNPLFIPVSAFVTAALIGSGIIAKNTEDAVNAGGQLVSDVISQIKSSEVAKSESDSSYDSPYRVINGGKPEKPDKSNKNGKWVAVAGGSLATHEIYANKSAIEDIMHKANDLGGYKKQTVSSGIVSADKFKNTANLSNVCLQLANVSNSALAQFNEFLHSDDWIQYNIDANDCYFAVNFDLNAIFSDYPAYPALDIRIYLKQENINKLYITKNLYSYGLFSNKWGSLYRYFPNMQKNGIKFLNDDNVIMYTDAWQFYVYKRYADGLFKVNGGKINDSCYYEVDNGPEGLFNPSVGCFCGYIGIVQSPMEFTNNIYNVNLQFDENFQNWMQGQIQGLGGQIIDAVRLGITSANPTWNPTQEQIQTGASPANVIYQFTNNYQNPDSVPEDDDKDQPAIIPPVDADPQPTDDYLGNFLLPETITTKFPFCIPFDIVRCLRLFSVSGREAPKWEYDFKYGSSTYHIVIDLATFNDVANLIRPIEYILFLVGLAIGTRSLIRG